MANQINFKPTPINPSAEYERQLAVAPQEHAEALLLLYELLQTAHDEGILDLLHGAIGSKDVLAGKVAEYAKLPAGINSIRNLLSMGKLLGSLDPDMLDKLARAVSDAGEAHKAEKKAPSLFELAKRANSEDARRGLSFMTLLLGSLGKSMAK